MEILRITYLILYVVILFVVPRSICAQDHSLYFTGQSKKALKQYIRELTKDYSESTLLNAVCVAQDLGLYADQQQLLTTVSSDHKTAHISAWQGWNCLAQGKRGGPDFFKQALKENPMEYMSILGLGLWHHTQENYSNAQGYYEQLIRHDQSISVGHYLLGLALYEQGKYHDVEIHLKKALKKDYAAPEIRFVRSDTFLQQERLKEAYASISKVLRIDPLNKTAKKYAALPSLIPFKEQAKKERTIKTLKKHRLLRAFPDAGDIPTIRVGLIVTGRGKPRKISSVKLNLNGTVTLVCSGKKTTLVTSDVPTEWKISVSRKKQGISITDEEGILTGFTTGYIVLNPLTAHDSVILRNIPYATGYAWAGNQDREYRGSIIIKKQSNGLVVINQLLFEEYLMSVLPSEMISSWPAEALKAQAVIARGFSRHKVIHPLHKSFGYDVCSSQHCQVYAGVRNEMKTTTAAVHETRGEVLKYRNRIANTLYSSNCGGHTQSNKHLKGWGDEPFLRGVSDAISNYPETPWDLYQWIHNMQPACYCAKSKYTYGAESRWIRVIPAEYVTERVNRRYRVGTVQDIQVLRRSPSGHIRKLRVVGKKTSVIIEKENRIRGTFAPGGLRSTYFTIFPISDGNKNKFFMFRGGGWGHAVGMCQSGAAGMAQQGKTYKEILSHYYKNTRIDTLPW